MRKSLLIFLLVVIVSCSSRPVPRNILIPETMQKVVYDLIRVDEFVNSFVVKDSATDIKKKRSILYEQVFKLNKTTRKEFYQSFKYYQQHPDIQKGLFDSLYENLNRKNAPVATPDTVKPVK